MYNQAFRLSDDSGRAAVPRWPSCCSCSSSRSSPTKSGSCGSERRSDEQRPSTTTGRPPRPARRPSPSAATKAGRVDASSPRRGPRVVADHHRDPLDDPDLRPVRLVAPARGRDQDHRLVDVLREPQPHPGELQRRALRAARRPPAGCRTSSTPSSITLPAVHVLDRARRDGRLRAVLGQLPRPGLLFIGDLRAADRAAADGADPAAAAIFVRATALHLGGTFFAGVDRAHAASACRWRCSCCTTSCPSCPTTLFEAARVDGAGHGDDLLADRAAAARRRRSRVRHLPVPAGSGTTCWWLWCSRPDRTPGR